VRFLITFRIPMDRGNAAIKKGTIGQLNQSILADLRAEAVYFTPVGGERGGYIVVNIDDASQIPAICEPLFLGFGATVQIDPVMTPEDLAQAESTLHRVTEKYG
jgi:hypothetical protein